MHQLAVLDLSYTQVDDAGLKLLQTLPVLRSRRLRGTKITDEGFRQFLAECRRWPSWTFATAVATSSLRAWKSSSRQQRRYLR